MKLRNFKQLGTAAILTAVLALNSCQKEEVIAPKTPNKTVTPIDFTKATFSKVDELQYNIMAIASAITDPAYGKATGILSCATVTKDEISMPHHAIIDFGTGCTNEDGVTSSGRVDIYYNFTTKSELRNNAGSEVSVIFSDFSEEGVTFNGTATLTNQGNSGDGKNRFDIDVNLALNDANTGQVTTLNGNNDYLFTRGYETTTREDDALEISGTLSGDWNGEAYSASITPSNPLIQYRMEGCNEFYVKGEMVYSYANQPTEYIDYGDGTCDNLAVKTVDGTPETITLN